MAVKVTFTYDEATRKWDPTVHGAENMTEARQAFSAVVLTCQELDPSLLQFAKTGTFDEPVTCDVAYRITPAV